MAVNRDDLVFLISALEALDSDWLSLPESPEDFTVVPQGQALLHLAATKVVDGMDETTVRRELLADVNDMIKVERVEKVEIQLLAAMLVVRLRERLAKLAK